MSSQVSELRAELKRYWNPEKADSHQKFFKSKDKQTKDIFRGVTVPRSRLIAKQFVNLPLNEIEELLTSPIHEERLIALFILVDQYQNGSTDQKSVLYEFYLKHTPFINDWDLIDSSSDKIVGEYLRDKSPNILYKLAKSDKWWERRIAILATYQFIKKDKKFEDTLGIAELLINDQHDLIHKAVGWMLREVGKRVSKEVEVEFLKKHNKKMPRTMLRYAIEHFPEAQRQQYLKGLV